MLLLLNAIVITALLLVYVGECLGSGHGINKYDVPADGITTEAITTEDKIFLTNMANALKDKGIKVVAFDYDQTMIKCHLGGDRAFALLLASLSQIDKCYLPTRDVQIFINLLLERDIKIWVVSFQDAGDGGTNESAVWYRRTENGGHYIFEESTTKINGGDAEERLLTINLHGKTKYKMFSSSGDTGPTLIGTTFLSGDLLWEGRSTLSIDVVSYYRDTPDFLKTELLANIGLSRNEVVLFDDDDHNVKSAKEAGYYAVQVNAVSVNAESERQWGFTVANVMDSWASSGLLKTGGSRSPSPEAAVEEAAVAEAAVAEARRTKSSPGSSRSSGSSRSGSRRGRRRTKSSPGSSRSSGSSRSGSRRGGRRRSV